MNAAQRLGGLIALALGLALTAGCHRRLPHPGKPIAAQPARPAAAPSPPPPPPPRSAPTAPANAAQP